MQCVQLVASWSALILDSSRNSALACTLCVNHQLPLLMTKFELNDRVKDSLKLYFTPVSNSKPLMSTLRPEQIYKSKKAAAARFQIKLDRLPTILIRRKCNYQLNKNK